jgi:hypothetical protein
MNPTDRTDKSTRDLRIALKTLSDQSLKTSRRLDDTYYSILEKLSVLRQTIGSLQELSGLTKELRDHFESDTKELLEDVQGQYDGFDNFDGQQQQIVVLEERMQVGKKKADSLTDRLAKAKDRVDARALSESEWTAKNTRTISPFLDIVHIQYWRRITGRTRIFWGTLGSIAAVIFAVIISHHFRPVTATHKLASNLDFASRAQIMEADLPDIAKEAIVGVPTGTSELKPTTTNLARVPAEDQRLRMFDEL